MEMKRNNQTCWFAAHTRCGAELRIREWLGRLGTEHFLPTELRSRTRGHSSYEKPLIPGLIFVRATKTQACALANEQGVPVRYLIDPATRSLLVVPDKQMDDFRRVLDLSTTEGGLVDRPLALGDRVRVTKGVLRGGGDTKMLMITDNIFLWVLAIPLGILAGFVFKLPAFWIYVCLKSDQIIKTFWSFLRLKSGKWIKKISTGK